MEHPVGFEPTASCLQGSCSTIELREQVAGMAPALFAFIFSFLVGVIFGGACSPSA